MPTPVDILAEAVGADAPALLPHFELVHVADGDVLLREGVASSNLYVLVEGVCEIVYESELGRVTLGRRPVGSWLGEVGLIDGGPASATVIASGPCAVLRLDAAVLARIVDERPAAASALLRHVTRQLAERLAASSSGILEQIAPGQVAVRKPEPVKHWARRALGWLVGAER